MCILVRQKVCGRGKEQSRRKAEMIVNERPCDFQCLDRVISLGPKKIQYIYIEIVVRGIVVWLLSIVANSAYSSVGSQFITLQVVSFSLYAVFALHLNVISFHTSYIHCWRAAARRTVSKQAMYGLVWLQTDVSILLTKCAGRTAVQRIIFISV